MALIKCTDCGSDVSDAAPACPKCGRPSALPTRFAVPAPPLTPSAATPRSQAAAIAVVILIGFGLWAYNDDTSSNAGDKAAAAAVAARPATASSTPSTVNQAQAKEDEQPLTGKGVAAAFSDYVGALQAKMFVAQLSFKLHTSQIQQAIQFNDLDKYRSTAEDLEENLKKIQADITDVSTPSNLSDADMAPFEDAMNAANDIVAQYLEVAADIGVNAHTGMDSSEEMAKDAKEVAGAQAKFTSTVQQGYKHLGVKRSDIDMATLTLKAGKAL